MTSHFKLLKLCSLSTNAGDKEVHYKVLFTSATYKADNWKEIVSDVLAISFSSKYGQKVINYS